MPNSFSIAEARHDLAALVHQLDRQPRIQRYAAIPTDKTRTALSHRLAEASNAVGRSKARASRRLPSRRSRSRSARATSSALR